MQKSSFLFILLWCWREIESLIKSQFLLPLKWICSWSWEKSHKVPELEFTLCYTAHTMKEPGERPSGQQVVERCHSLDMLDRSHLQIWFYSIILFYGLGLPPCRLSAEKTPFPCLNMLWSLHPHQLGWRGLCCCDKQLCSLWVKSVLERPLPHILSAHCLEGNTFGQHPDTIPCCAELQRVSQLPYCAEGNRELGHYHFLSFLHCAVVFKSFCVLGQVEVPAHPSTLKCMLQARGVFPCVLLPAATTKNMGSVRPYDVTRGMSRAVGGLVASSRER